MSTMYGMRIFVCFCKTEILLFDPPASSSENVVWFYSISIHVHSTFHTHKITFHSEREWKSDQDHCYGMQSEWNGNCTH